MIQVAFYASVDRNGMVRAMEWPDDDAIGNEIDSISTDLDDLGINDACFKNSDGKYVVGVYLVSAEMAYFEDDLEYKNVTAKLVYAPDLTQMKSVATPASGEVEED